MKEVPAIASKASKRCEGDNDSRLRSVSLPQGRKEEEGCVFDMGLEGQ